MSKPYADPPDTAGFLVKSEETIREQVRLAHRGGWQVALHAIGDRAIEATLDAVEAVMGPEASQFRPRVEHACVLRPDLIDRIRRLGAVVVTQPRFAFEFGDGYRQALGEERLRLTVPLASLRGLHLAFSSDRPVTDGAPLLGIAAAVLRRTASGAPYVSEEAVTVEEAIRAYTLGAAYSTFAEGELGSLELGKWADFVVLDRDPFAVDPEEIARIRVLRTVVGGRCVYPSAGASD